MVAVVVVVVMVLVLLMWSGLHSRLRDDGGRGWRRECILEAGFCDVREPAAVGAMSDGRGIAFLPFFLLSFRLLIAFAAAATASFFLGLALA